MVTQPVVIMDRQTLMVIPLMADNYLNIEYIDLSIAPKIATITSQI